MSPAGRSGRPDAPLHLVFVPFLARSHFAPLAAKAADACGQRVGATATTAAIVTTPHFAALAPPCVPVHVAGFRCPGGHEDFSQLPDDEASSAPAFFSAAEAALAPALAAVLRAQDGPVAVVSDAVLYWVPRVARECGAPHVTFHTIGAFAASAMVAVHLHRPEAFLDPFVVPGGFPRHVKLRRAQINEEALAHLPLFRAAEAQSYAVAFNSFAALEANFAAYYQSQLAGRPKKVFLVGPALAAAASPRAVTGGAERDPILQWLDGRPAGSVVYVCFGSTCALGESQLRELATGLRASGRTFLWVIPAARGEGGAAREERASSHGMVVAGRWAPQAEILAHRAVGGFVTHCGWNSVLEAVRAGVPLATWPLRAEQFVNEAFLVEVLRVGVRVREVAREEAGLEALVPAGAVTRAVGRLMGDGQGEAEAVAGRRARARELGSAARAAVAEGGSSCGDWARLVEELKALHGRDSDPQV
ncbi:UDP-glycosyltransferase 73C4-like [Panicum hallii]|jgi:UDP:flavonoid glycosyltransferase YjiC (YdhE family)|nr:UDP-glycosyltransferase 73C4-like [Panicum hallii]